MRLSDSYLRCVAYLGNPLAGGDGEIDPYGTGFLVNHDGIIHLVTAGHVADDLKDLTPFGVRLNNKSGHGQIDYIESGKWFYHSSYPLVDVAVRPYAIPSWADVTASPTKHIATEFKVQSKDIGVGDLAYVVGVFRHLPGKKKNVPVVHTGHIATMARDEKITTLNWTKKNVKPQPTLDIDGYLVEARTLRAASGSPVFVRRSLKTTITEKEIQPTPLRAWTYGSVWLLGMWHGAWISDLEVQLGIKENSFPIEFGIGIGITVPAPKIIETLDLPELVTLRKEIKQREARKVAATPLAIPSDVSAEASLEPNFGDAILKIMLDSSPKPLSKSKPKARKRGG